NHNHARTWELLRLTRMPVVQVVLGYLSNPHDASVLTNPSSRDDIAEAIVVAVKRLYLLDDDDAPTGTYNFAELLRAEQAPSSLAPTDNHRSHRRFTSLAALISLYA